ncbi:MAG: hypothetical protein HZC41_23475 [Chloroflexi bacterium]|nr:hypothetical protein [Chloroflexota bacterium]
MAAAKTAAARLFVILASQASVGVILRRGPSDWVQLIRWDTETDEFTPGQWFHGRVYEAKCDLSPDGELLVYFAYKPVNRADSPDYGDQWTAVSRPPYFTALALWPRGSLFGGGGYFLDRRRLLLNHLYEDHAPHPDHPPPAGFEVTGADERTYLHGNILEQRLARDGWQKDAGHWIKTGGELKLTCTVYADHRTLMERGLYHHTFYDVAPVLRWRLADLAGDKTYHVAGMIWADFDHRQRLVLARQGKLYSGERTGGELVLTELADFNASQPERMEAPEWAAQWPF